MKKYVICDLDGTLALIDHRRHLALEGGFKSFEYHLNIQEDKPNTNLIAILDELVYSGHKIILLSGRRDSTKEVTEEWLERYEVLYHYLFMRSSDDSRDDKIVKKELLDQVLETLRITKDDILCVFDDRNKVVQMWREEGLFCFQVADGDF